MSLPSSFLLFPSDPYIYPHTDSANKISINFYLKTHDAVTAFYNVKRALSSLTFGSKIEGQTDGSIYDENSLVKINEFTAKDGQVWILNTRRIHSVKMKMTGKQPLYLPKLLLTFIVCFGRNRFLLFRFIILNHLPANYNLLILRACIYAMCRWGCRSN